MHAHVADESARAIGRALRARRESLRINMAAAAEAAHMSRVTWYRLEKGELGVAWGFLLAAAEVLDMRMLLQSGEDIDVDRPPAPSLEQWLPLHILLADFPGLRRVAWQLREGLDSVTPREAWELYERNWRHLDLEDVSERERALIAALTRTFGDPRATV